MVEKYVESLVEQKLIEPEKKEIYAYGLRQGILIIVNFATVAAIGAVLGMLLESMVIMIQLSEVLTAKK